MGGYLVVAMDSNEDEHCCRLACGLTSDLANHSTKEYFSKYVAEFMRCLNKVLKEADY